MVSAYCDENYIENISAVFYCISGERKIDLKLVPELVSFVREYVLTLTETEKKIYYHYIADIDLEDTVAAVNLPAPEILVTRNKILNRAYDFLCSNINVFGRDKAKNSAYAALVLDSGFSVSKLSELFDEEYSTTVILRRLLNRISDAAICNFYIAYSKIVAMR